MSLFKQLQRLYRPDRFLLEDFHTEIVARVLCNSHRLTLDWLIGIGATALSKIDNMVIQTQEEFAALPGHFTASRPDITIRLTAAGQREMIFVESKVPSVQGEDQLQRYAEHLENITKNEAADRTALVSLPATTKLRSRRNVRTGNFNRRLSKPAGFSFTAI